MVLLLTPGLYLGDRDANLLNSCMSWTGLSFSYRNVYSMTRRRRSTSEILSLFNRFVTACRHTEHKRNYTRNDLSSTDFHIIKSPVLGKRQLKLHNSILINICGSIHVPLSTSDMRMSSVSELTSHWIGSLGRYLSASNMFQRFET